mmetsp:Transcript_21204/g.20367  ORF Transcript_21204/g.20367 Transcript_21204/m.20367 type:complete len:96 (+) Transcript_21204:516-803(+)|eukprot:CAMPEP_0170551166 /NCGR_PEP_ID=MMETSP0211-20121228/9196_1 /TAXON_ID=311385 /ORGANISM="Pseudokeronopsis sp., Strain OXSARD2" /LENGTH=95 /DNA_ID=CAMNT_0010858167 /DNA_START=668 /DNA_END=955 /DNA_ORIENTATION=+
MVLKAKPEYHDLIEVFEAEYEQLMNTVSNGVPGYGAVNLGYEHNGENLPTMRGEGPVDRRKRERNGGPGDPMNISLDYIFLKKELGQDFIDEGIN